MILHEVHLFSLSQYFVRNISLFFFEEKKRRGRRKERVALLLPFNMSDVKSSLCTDRACLCRRWVNVDYYGDRLISGREWNDFFVKKLRGIECEFIGCNYIDDKSMWHLFIYLRDLTTSREEVAARFQSKDVATELQRLGESKVLTNDVSADGSRLKVFMHCCHDQFLRLAGPFSSKRDAFFASDERFFRRILESETTRLLSGFPSFGSYN